MFPLRPSLLLTALSLLVGYASSQSTTSASLRTDLIKLVPFDVQLAIKGTPRIDSGTLTQLTTEWMNESFQIKSVSQALLVGNETRFGTIALEFVQGGVFRRRELQESQQATIYTASFTGISLWEREADVEALNPDLVELLQLATLIEDKQLLAKFQGVSEATGLGNLVIDVRAELTPETLPVEGNGNDDDSDDTAQLEMIIIIAISVACLAFGLLMIAVCWAYKTDKARRDATFRNHRRSGSHSHSQHKQRSNGSTGETTDNDAETPPNVIDNTPGYAESAISEDVSTSLTDYYRSGVHGYGVHGQGSSSGYHRRGDDAASMSSMDSYGYSLDGYSYAQQSMPTTSASGRDGSHYPIVLNSSMDSEEADPLPVRKASSVDMSEVASETTDL